MNTDSITREQLLNLLRKSHAHMDFDDAVKDYPMDQINTLFPNGEYSAWALLEHIRITQNDILVFITNPNYQDMEWPKDYWPRPGTKATPADWQRTIAAFHSDLKHLEDIVQDSKTDLYARIPHGTGQNIFREILLVADHNAYHIGEFAIMRQVMGAWGTARH
jgi:DinB family protein